MIILTEAGRLKPLLSIVITIASDTVRQPSVDHLRPCLASLRVQANAPSVEVIVPHQPRYPEMDRLRHEFPEVRFLEISDLKRYTGRTGSREHHNELRARAIAAASGEIVALTEDHAVADPHWCERIAHAHKQPVAAVGGAIENAVPRLLNWAVYFREFGPYQNPVGDAGTHGPSDVNVSYKRADLQAIRSVWAGSFEEHAVNRALRAAGKRIVFSPDIVVYQNRMNLDLRTAVRERWIWGRSYGRWRDLKGLARFAWAGASLVLPFVAVARMAATVARKKRNTGVFLRALPLVVVMAAAWSWGEMAAYLTGPGGEHASY